MTQLALAKPAFAAYVAPVRAPTEHLPLLDTSTLPSTPFWSTLGMAVTMRRDYGSATEAAYVAWLANRLPVSLIDGAGNVHVDLRTQPDHRSMFTSHTDTVHSSGGANKVRVDGKFWRADAGSALGADDGAGNAIMAHMINAGVPGYYVFFRGEERGGVGSSWLAKNMPELFVDIDRAVAFDRAGYADVITHQSGGRCCSDEFAEALATQLSSDTDWYMPCNTGVYTDTAEFTRLIPECTNLSVGYKNQHGDREEQDVEFLWDLAQRSVAAQWDDLPTKRDPKVRESKYADMYDPYEAYVPSGDGVYYGQPKTALDEYDDLDDDANILCDIIESAIETGLYGRLIELIAEAACPEDPDAAKRHLNPRMLDDERLEEAANMLYDGWTADQVLGDLFDACVTI
jgi:hypothetical protein